MGYPNPAWGVFFAWFNQVSGKNGLYFAICRFKKLNKKKVKKLK